jgi:hypothetical protein
VIGFAGTGKRWPLRGWIGLLLVGVFWAFNWALPGLRTHQGFFPLWLGYCLVVDAWTWHRSGTSLVERSPRAYAGLFLASSAIWWLFEILNARTGNWRYLGREEFSRLEYYLLASLSFSIVLPAVFGTAELVGSSKWLRRMRRLRPLAVPGPWWATPLAGALFLGLCLGWPRYFFPFLWFSIFLIVDPVNRRRGDPSILGFVSVGEWRPAISLGVGCLVCGFFWEMWNAYSYPKWVYEIPFVDFIRVFEMPLLGYGGYVPFALELFALYHLMARWAGMRREGFVRLPGSRMLS